MSAVRPARFADIPGIVRLCEQARQASKYSAVSDLREPHLKAILMDMIGKSGGKDVGSTFVAVSEKGIGLDGVVVGVCAHLYEALNIRLVTDIFWFTAPGAEIATGKRLLRALHAWADTMPGPLILRHGVTDAIADPDRSAKMLERMKFRRVGHIYEKELRT